MLATDTSVSVGSREVWREGDWRIELGEKRPFVDGWAVWSMSFKDVRGQELGMRVFSCGDNPLEALTCCPNIFTFMFGMASAPQPLPGGGERVQSAKIIQKMIETLGKDAAQSVFVEECALGQGSNIITEEAENKTVGKWDIDYSGRGDIGTWSRLVGLFSERFGEMRKLNNQRKIGFYSSAAVQPAVIALAEGKLKEDETIFHGPVAYEAKTFFTNAIVGLVAVLAQHEKLEPGARGIYLLGQVAMKMLAEATGAESFASGTTPNTPFEQFVANTLSFTDGVFGGFAKMLGQIPKETLQKVTVLFSRNDAFVDSKKLVREIDNAGISVAQEWSESGHGVADLAVEKVAGLLIGKMTSKD